MVTNKQKEIVKNSVTEEAAQMMTVFLKPEANQPKAVQWKNQYKSQAMRLLWRCNLEQITPPVDLVVLVGCLFGERHNWSYAKYAAASYLALHHTPTPANETLPDGLKSEVGRIIAECGGDLKKTRKIDDAKGNMGHDHRRTLDGWREEPLFNYVWQQKYDKDQNRQMSPHKFFRDQVLEAIKREFPSLKQGDN